MPLMYVWSLDKVGAISRDCHNCLRMLHMFHFVTEASSGESDSISLYKSGMFNLYGISILILMSEVLFD